MLPGNFPPTSRVHAIRKGRANRKSRKIRPAPRRSGGAPVASAQSEALTYRIDQCLFLDLDDEDRRSCRADASPRLDERVLSRLAAGASCRGAGAARPGLLCRTLGADDLGAASLRLAAGAVARGVGDNLCAEGRVTVGCLVRPLPEDRSTVVLSVDWRWIAALRAWSCRDTTALFRELPDAVERLF